MDIFGCLTEGEGLNDTIMNHVLTDCADVCGFIIATPDGMQPRDDAIVPQKELAEHINAIPKKSIVLPLKVQGRRWVTVCLDRKASTITVFDNVPTSSATWKEVQQVVRERMISVLTDREVDGF
jgi:hypothetical protein